MKKSVTFRVNIIGDHANNANILDRSVHTRRKNIEALVLASKEIGLEVNADKTKYMVMSGDKNAGRSGDIKTDNSNSKDIQITAKGLMTILCRFTELHVVGND